MKRELLFPVLFISGLLTSPLECTENSLNELSERLESLGTREVDSSFAYFGKESSNDFHAARKSWATYRQSYGSEKVKIKFPAPPHIAQEKGVVYTASSKKEAHYTMVAGMPPLGGIKAKEAFPIALASLCQHPHRLIDYRTSKSDGSHLLDTVSEDSYSKAVTKQRMIITPRNFYILRTISYAGESEHHDYFVDSFTISY